jgi:dCTP deaminase
MILTGRAIKEERKAGRIIIEPFDERQLNPNSYNYRLDDELIWLQPSNVDSASEQVRLPSSGFTLLPRNLYLAVTREVIGSPTYAMTLLGRSTLGRLGLFLNVTADLGHVGSASRWTLELTVVQPLRIYPNVCVGQIAFWQQYGSHCSYGGRYHLDHSPVANRDLSLLAPATHT